MKNVIEPGICFTIYIAEKKRKKKLINIMVQLQHQTVSGFSSISAALSSPIYGLG